MSQRNCQLNTKLMTMKKYNMSCLNEYYQCVNLNPSLLESDKVMKACELFGSPGTPNTGSGLHKLSPSKIKAFQSSSKEGQEEKVFLAQY